MLSGRLLIGGATRRGINGEIWGTEAATGRRLDPSFGGATLEDLEEACSLADAAFDTFRATSLEDRAALLEKIADNINSIGDELVDRCVCESGLSKARIQGELNRTVGQLKLFASVVREGAFLEVRIDKALPSRNPLPRPDIRLRNTGIGPVAVFGASNFPLAFSVAGGDTTSALAAGCPVIVKAHSAHPGTSELVGRAIQNAVKECAMPEGTFSLIFDSARAVSQALVANRLIKAVGFTGSRAAGVAFMQIAANRSEPIPVYAEMSSINPVILLPNALAARGAEIGTQLVAALTLGAGQFCTNPGLVLVVEGQGYHGFLEAVQIAISTTPAATMLTPNIHRSYCTAVDRLAAHKEIKCVARGRQGGEYEAKAGVFETTGDAFLLHPELQEEIFGASTLVVRCRDQDELRRAVDHLEGQLTISVHADTGDYAVAGGLVPLLERRAGRLIVNGFGTGVEVSHAMVHGGPFPATSDVRTTSVGSLAIARFLRPISYQNFPADLLPGAVLTTNPSNVPQRLDPKSL